MVPVLYDRFDLLEYLQTRTERPVSNYTGCAIFRNLTSQKHVTRDRNHLLLSPSPPLGRLSVKCAKARNKEYAVSPTGEGGGESGGRGYVIAARFTYVPSKIEIRRHDVETE